MYKVLCKEFLSKIKKSTGHLKPTRRLNELE